MNEHDDYARGYLSGQWRAYNEVLDIINTLEENVVDKKQLYKAVIALRPKKENDDQARTD